MLRDALQRIMREYPSVSHSDDLKENPLAEFIRGSAKNEVRSLIDSEDPEKTFKVEGSPGKGNWAQIPWIGIFDSVVTTSATRGYYVVYLISADGQYAYLSLNQGTTAIREEFGARYLNELRRRADLMRDRISDDPDANVFSSDPISLAGSGALPAGYEAGHVLGAHYHEDSMPSDKQLERELHAILRAYLRLTARGGLDPSIEDSEEKGSNKIIEKRQYRFHRKIERDSRASAMAKKIHGYYCQACGFNFHEVYGQLGKEFIEAHHLKPLANLPENQPVPQDPHNDFAVLCSNCHRMIHKMEDVGDLKGFREMNEISRYRSLLQEAYDF